MRNSVSNLSDLNMLMGLKTVECTPERLEAATAPKVKKIKCAPKAPASRQTFDYLDKEQLAQFKLIRALRDGSIEFPDDLLVKLYQFDHNYEYSDSAQVYNANDQYKRELMVLINDREFDEETRRIYMSSFQGTGLLLKHYPQLMAMYYMDRAPRNEIALALDGVTDVEVNNVGFLANILARAMLRINNDMSEGTVYTNAIKDVSREVSRKISICQEAQVGILDFETSLTRQHLKIMACIDTYVSVNNKYYTILLMESPLYNDNVAVPRFKIVLTHEQSTVAEVQLYLNPQR